MASEKAKHLKKEEDDDENDEKSLSSLLQNKHKKPNGSGLSMTKSLSLKDAKKKLESKLKKEDESDDDFMPIKKIPSNVKPNKERSACAETKKTTVSKVKKEEAGCDNMKKTPISGVKKEKSASADKKKREKSSEQNGKKKEGKKMDVKEEDVSIKKEKKEKKVYDLPGQKRDPPEERDPLRIFYESLYTQIPSSEMAAIWMMESGLLHKDVAKKLFEAKRKKAQQKLGSPMKTVVSVKKQSDSSSVLVKKKIVSTEKKKTPPTQSKKRKMEDESDEGSDDDFVISRKIKKPKAA
ncbi:hypothetical protein R6Q59_029981 [Mikania micrantha]|uniref:Uncharacterized protein n=1 Tax=Mikania micrantha TaxID=192012 RepID=A0A5N6LH88_9ASTR|nr:hypothetical protein E3N88_42635 [Mikania micrantha]